MVEVTRHYTKVLCLINLPINSIRKYLLLTLLQRHLWMRHLKLQKSFCSILKEYSPLQLAIIRKNSILFKSSWSVADTA